MWANFNTYLKGIQMALVGNQVSDPVRFTVFPIWGWPGNIRKMGTYWKCVLSRSIPKRKRTMTRGKGTSCMSKPQAGLQRRTSYIILLCLQSLDFPMGSQVNRWAASLILPYYIRPPVQCYLLGKLPRAKGQDSRPGVP